MDNFLTFSSPTIFTLTTNNTTKNWDGTLEYSTDKTNWQTWNGTTTLTAVSDGTNYNLYLRGTGNTYISNSNQYDFTNWVLGPANARNISCLGNIETLLDYQTVAGGNHPTMANGCFYGLFENNESLIKAPELPATTLSENCYSYMFAYCYSLQNIPQLPATTLVAGCYNGMFQYCSKIKLSTTQTGNYQTEFRIPTTGTGTIIGIYGTMTNMFLNTGGTFTGTPTINTTYYLYTEEQQKYLDGTGLAEFTTNIKNYFDKEFYGENTLMTADGKYLLTSDEKFLNYTQGGV